MCNYFEETQKAKMAKKILDKKEKEENIVSFIMLVNILFLYVISHI